jgi:hypothetical protein
MFPRSYDVFDVPIRLLALFCLIFLYWGHENMRFRHVSKRSESVFCMVLNILGSLSSSGRVCRCCSAAHQTRVTDGPVNDSSQTLTWSPQICMLRMPRACPFLRMFPYLFLSLHVWTLVDKACARPDFDRCVCSRHVCCHK